MLLNFINDNPEENNIPSFLNKYNYY